MKRFIQQIIITILVLSFLFWVNCSHKPGIWEMPSGTNKADEELMQKIESAGSRMEYPNAKAIVIEDIDSTIFTPDGSFTQYNYSLTKLITLTGAKDYGTMGLPYDTLFFEIEIPLARIIQEDGSIINIPDSLITDETMSDLVMMDVFWTNIRRKVINFPELSSGSTIEYLIIYKTIQPRFEGIFDNSRYFQSDEPIKYSRSVVVGPASMPLDWKIRNDEDNLVSFDKKEMGELVKYTWEAQDIPQVIMEEGMPPFTDMAIGLLASTTTWRDYSKKIYEYLEPVMKTDEAIESKVAELIEGKESEYEKIRAIFYYVAQKIRYLGLAMSSREGIQPHPVTETFERQAGVCKDKASLLAAMLQSAGIEAYYVLSNPLNHVDKDIAASQFNHAITLAVTKDGKRYFLDSTDEFCQDMLPAYHQEQGILVCDKDGEDMEYLPSQPPEMNSGKVDIKSTIQPNGTLRGTATISGKGIYDEVIRQVVRMQEGAQLKRFIERLVNRVHPNSRIIEYNIEPDPIMNLYEDAVITIEFEIEEYAIMAGKYLLIKPVGLEYPFDIFVTTYLTMFTQLEERKFPLNIQFTSGVVSNEEIILPPGYKAKVLPESKSLNYKPGSFSMSYQFKDKLIFRNSIMINESEIPPEEYEDFRKIKEEMAESSSGLAIFIKDEQP
ncbi:DUF3857 domain-containing protein [bacterium]|nr:DUF3857 domain-containing protein [bacterium]